MPTLNPIIKRAGTTQPDDSVLPEPRGGTAEPGVAASAVAPARSKINIERDVCVIVWR